MRRSLLCLLLVAAALLSCALSASASAVSPVLPPASTSLHHLALYTSPAHPPTQITFLLFTLPQSQAVKLKQSVAGEGGDAEDEFAYTSLAQLRSVAELGADFAEIRCGSQDGLESVRMSLHPSALSDDIHEHGASDSAATDAAHLSSFDHWLIGNEMQQSLAQQQSVSSGVGRRIRRHAPQTFLMPQVAGHRASPLGRYIHSLPSVRRLLRSHPHSLLFAAIVSSHLPYYVELNHLDARNFMAFSSPSDQAAVGPAWQCDIQIKAPREQAAWPITQLVSQARDRRGAPRFAPLVGRTTFAPPAVDAIARSGVWIHVPSRSTAAIVASELRLTAGELAAAESSRSERADYASQDIPGAVSLLQLDAVLGVQAAAVKAVVPPVLELLKETIADEGEHTADQQVGSKLDTNTPSQVMELSMAPLKHMLNLGVTESVSSTVQGSLVNSMGEFLTQYFHDEITHDATPALYLALVEILEKHVKDQILKTVPPAVRKVVPVVLTNRLGRALIHSIPPALVQVLKISHSPTLHYFCHRCYYGAAIAGKEYSLFKPLSPGMPHSRYKDKHYCELCHSSAERLYYHNYHAAFYADYYADYYTPYYAQSLVEMEKTRTGRDNNELNQPASKEDTNIPGAGAGAGAGGAEGAGAEEDAGGMEEGAAEGEAGAAEGEAGGEEAAAVDGGEDEQLTFQGRR